MSEFTSLTIKVQTRISFRPLCKKSFYAQQGAAMRRKFDREVFLATQIFPQPQVADFWRGRKTEIMPGIIHDNGFGRAIEKPDRQRAVGKFLHPQFRPRRRDQYLPRPFS